MLLNAIIKQASKYRADSRLAPSQWKTALQSNAVFHWLGAHLESDLTISEIIDIMCVCSCDLYTAAWPAWLVAIARRHHPEDRQGSFARVQEITFSLKKVLKSFRDKNYIQNISHTTTRPRGSLKEWQLWIEQKRWFWRLIGVLTLNNETDHFFPKTVHPSKYICIYYIHI